MISAIVHVVKDWCVVVHVYILYLMYSRSRAADVLRSFLFVKLGHWHVYKQANLLLWSSHGHVFLCPLYQHLFPAAHAIKKPRLVVLETFFTYVTLSHPSWKDALKAGMENRNTMPIMRSAMFLLYDLVEVFIPMVRYEHDRP